MKKNRLEALGDGGIAIIITVMVLELKVPLLLARALVAHHGKTSPLALALGKDRKGLVSIALYALAVPLSMLHAWLGIALYVGVAVLWFIPDRRIEARLAR